VPIDPKSKADFDAAITEFAKSVGVHRDIICNEQMRLLLRDAMTFTPPMPKGGGRGLSVAAHKAGMGKTAKDIKRIFIPADSPKKGMPVLLRRVINSVRGDDRQAFMDIYGKYDSAKAKGISPVMRKILDDTSWERSFKKAKNYLNKASIFGDIGEIAGFTSDLRGIHDKYKGAVGGRWRKNAPIGGPQYMVGTALQLEAYIAERQYKVGRVKAGWASAMLLIPPLVSEKGTARRVGVYDASWVDANRSSMGQFSMSKNKTTTSMTATNLIGNINSVATDSNMENIVYGNRVQQLRVTVQARIRDATEKANRKK
jgi:hypothetical protein